MIDTSDIRSDASTPKGQGSVVRRAEALEQKMEELVEFREAGVLTEAELEEQKAKLRWGVG